MPSSTDFPTYIRNLIALGHDRHWLRRNEPALVQRFAMDPTPFPPLPEPVRVRDRYEEL